MCATIVYYLPYGNPDQPLKFKNGAVWVVIFTICTYISSVYENWTEWYNYLLKCAPTPIQS